MAVQINPQRLRLELARRGWDQATFAKHAAVTENTVSNAMRGKPISQAVLQRMIVALANAPVDELRDALIAAPVPV